MPRAPVHKRTGTQLNTLTCWSFRAGTGALEPSPPWSPGTGQCTDSRRSQSSPACTFSTRAPKRSHRASKRSGPRRWPGSGTAENTSRARRAPTARADVRSTCRPKRRSRWLEGNPANIQPRHGKQPSKRYEIGCLQHNTASTGSKRGQGGVSTPHRNKPCQPQARTSSPRERGVVEHGGPGDGCERGWPGTVGCCCRPSAGRGPCAAGQLPAQGQDGLAH